VSEYKDIVWCVLCTTDSGRTHATAPCCFVRRVSKMPFAQRRVAFDRVRIAGDQTAEELRTAVLRSMAMRVATLPKAARLEAYRRALRDGWLPPEVEQLKRFAKEEFDRGAADGS
jgi:hypothetical protein